MQNLLSEFPRLKDFYSIGPVQRAELESFVEAIAKSKVVSVTADGVPVKENDKVWVISGLGIPEQTHVQPFVATTSYHLFGRVPVMESFSTKEAAERYYI